jgi:hypothetical protein
MMETHEEYMKRRTPPSGFDWESCVTCGRGGCVLNAAKTEYEPCPTCAAPLLDGDPDRCKQVGGGLWHGKRCRLRHGHWAYVSRAGVNGHLFGSVDENSSEMYIAAHRLAPKAFP